MKRFVFAVGVLALGFAASTPARADFSLVKFESAFCRIWWNDSAKSDGDPLVPYRDRAGFDGRLGRAGRRCQKGQVQISKPH